MAVERLRDIPGSDIDAVGAVAAVAAAAAARAAGAVAAAAAAAADDPDVLRPEERRRDEVLRQLDGPPVVRPAGAWPAPLDVAALGLGRAGASARLLDHRVAATDMRGGGGAGAGRRVRIVATEEPIERLAPLGERARAALGPA